MTAIESNGCRGIYYGLKFSVLLWAIIIIVVIIIIHLSGSSMRHGMGAINGTRHTV